MVLDPLAKGGVTRFMQGGSRNVFVVTRHVSSVVIAKLLK